jgi:NAD(P)H-flavin reductase
MSVARNEVGSIYVPELATIVRTEKLTDTEKLFEIKFDSGRELGHQPGQFVEVSVFGIGEAPISVSSSPTRNGTFELAVRRAGNVTGALHTMDAGSTIGIRGPFGTSFPVDEMKGHDVLIVAGGIGLVPLRSLIHYILDNRKDYNRLVVFFGARSPAERLFVDELVDLNKRADVEYHETVDRGDETWNGNVGVITTLFPHADMDPSRTYCVVVGPPVMYKFVILEAKGKGLPDKRIILSLERRMKCGVGKCGHCQINGVYVCQDGPVFRLSEIRSLPEAL